MNSKVLIPIFFVLTVAVLAAGCTEKNSEAQAPELMSPELVKDVPTSYGTLIHVDTTGGVVSGYVTEDPERILNVSDGTWMFIQDNSSGYFELEGKFQNLDSVSPVKISFPNGKTATLNRFWWEDIRTDERGVKYYYLRVDQQGFKALGSGIINEKKYGKWEEESRDTDYLNDGNNPIERFKIAFTEEEIISGDRWLIRISGEYY